MDIKTLASDWEQDWTVTITEPSQQDLASEHPAKISELDPEDPTEKWLDFVLSPGQVPETVLETALLAYNDDKDKIPLPQNLAKASLKERLAAVVGSRIDTGAISGDPSKLREQKLRVWTHYWSIVCELDQARWDFLSLEYDEHAESAWLTFADGCSVVRHCGAIERIAYNAPESLANSTSQAVEDETAMPESADLATLITLAAKFRASFSEDLEYLCSTALQRELWQDNPHAITVRIQNFYEKCNLEKVTDQQYNDLMKGLERLPELTTELLMSLIRLFLQEMSTESSTLQSTRFGLKVLVRGAQEMIELHTRILTDLLYFVTFIDSETETDLLLDDFDASQIFTELLNLLRKYQVLQWLATHSRQVPVNRRNSVSRRDSISQTGPPRKVITTVLENLFAVDTKPQSYTNKSQCETITGSIEDLLRWATGGNDPAITLNSALVSIQCDLLKHNNIDLASDFLLFQPSTSWATYIRGCLYLLRSEFTEAANYFKKAAYNLCKFPFDLPVPTFSNTPSQPAQALTSTTPSPHPTISLP
jgi:nuclear pore complex protein Nup160